MDSEFKKHTSWRTRLKYGFSAEVKMHMEIDPTQVTAELLELMLPRVWCTYLIFSDSLEDPFNFRGNGRTIIPCKFVDLLWAEAKEGRSPLEELDIWNGGVTYVEARVTSKHGREVIVGDDYAHSHDIGRHREYTLESMQKRILKVAAKAHAFLTSGKMPAAPLATDPLLLAMDQKRSIE